jgi:hypothetical protein
MDLVVNKETGINLIRLHDDLWLCGPPDKCAKGWKAMERYAKVAGLDFNLSKTGSVYLTEGKPKNSNVTATLPTGPVCVGFLVLDPASGEWIIDQAQVGKHVAQLKSQLDECDSILAWVQTWNSCIGRFFSHTFGEPGWCFGRKHLDSILETHKQIEMRLFGRPADGKKGNVTTHLRRMIVSQFGKIEIPDAFFYLPEQLGGLGLRNPFIPLLLVRDNIPENPADIMAKFIKDEEDQYAKHKKIYDALGKSGQRKQFKKAYPHDAPNFDPETYLTFKEYTADRFNTNPLLRSVYTKLTDIPGENTIRVDSQARKELMQLESGFEDGKKLTDEEKWIIMIYRKELLEGVGSLRLVEQGFLPLGVLTMMRMKKVTWQMVL